jgi:hypothetical protein
MFEYHGWISVRTSPEADADEPPSPQLYERLRARIDEIASPYLLDLRWMNGEVFIHLGGFPNHRPSRELSALFEHVGAIAPGSYGLLHIWDDEDPGHENEVRVLRLVRGAVTEHTETLLSPCIPTLEDPF